MHTNAKQILQTFRPIKILLPIAIGLSVTSYLLISEYNPEAFSRVHWSWNSTFWIGIALLMMGVRDFAYMVRIRALTDWELNWKSSFVVIMLWEFSSALAPGIIGGGFLFAIFILNRESINMGRSITAILLSSFQDGVFLVLMVPLVYLFVGDNLFTTYGVAYFYFWFTYFVILAYKLFVAYALFVNPRLVKWLLLKSFSLPFLRRWKTNALLAGNQLVIASEGLKNKSRKFWTYSFMGTFVSWTARYTIVNCIILAFHSAPVDNLLVFARQVIMGIIILFTPTPGGAGFAEAMFNNFLGEFTPAGLSSALGTLWRFISYYPYLFIGAILLPRWIRSRFTKEEIA